MYGCELIALYIILLIFDVISEPRLPDNGNEKKVIFRTENFLFNRLQVNRWLFTGLIIGVVADKKDCVVIWGNTG